MEILFVPFEIITRIYKFSMSLAASTFCPQDQHLMGLLPDT